MKTLGKYMLFLWSSVKRGESFRIILNRTIDEANLIGINSVMIVAIVATFMGAVVCVQTAYNLENPFVPRYVIATIVRDMTILELGPTIISIVLAGKVGSNIAGGLGTMRITEQVDALEVMGINSTNFLVLPKILASVIMFPMLIILAMTLCILGGYISGTLTNALTSQEYINGLRYAFIPYNLVFALIKAVVFAFVISSISAYKGFFTDGGALEVGEASTQAVTNSIIWVLVFDFLLAQVLL
ncbi:MAG: ABC transporter permease [Chitinophagaceae bacterium]|nr:MAG: ABC transporter permease [Chitinophagaceae bacterium]